MGLDSYYFAVKTVKGVEKRICLRNPTPGHNNTWRKYQPLHDFMESIWISKGRPGAAPAPSAPNRDVKVIHEADSATIIVPMQSDTPLFNQVAFPLPAAVLEIWFRIHDPDFDTPNSVDYPNATDEDGKLSHAEYYRNWNQQILKLAYAMEKKGFVMEYNSWW